MAWAGANGSGAAEGWDVSSVEELGLPFGASYSSNGALEGLEMSDEDPPWSRNMKRALAATLQLRLDTLNAPSIIADEVRSS